MTYRHTHRQTQPFIALDCRVPISKLIITIKCKEVKTYFASYTCDSDLIFTCDLCWSQAETRRSVSRCGVSGRSPLPGHISNCLKPYFEKHSRVVAHGQCKISNLINCQAIGTGTGDGNGLQSRHLNILFGKTQNRAIDRQGRGNAMLP